MLFRLLASLGLSLALAASKEAPVEVPRLETPVLSVLGADVSAAASPATANIAPIVPAPALSAGTVAEPPTLPVSPQLAAQTAQVTATPAAKASPQAATAEGKPESIESASAQAAERFDKTAVIDSPNGGYADPAATLAANYQDGIAAPNARTQRVLERAADQAVRAKLAEGHFKVFYLYGGIMGTKMYEAPELPGVLLKTYSSPLGWKGKAWKGYNMAKARLGGLFAETTIIENVEVTIEGKKRTLPWALVQEKVRVENVQNFGRRSNEVLYGMLKRGVRDNDRRQPGVEQLDIHRNLGETNDGRIVHFDADFFSLEKGQPEEAPKRVRDPPALREAIRDAQLAALKPQAMPEWSFLDQGALTAPEKEALIDFAGKVVAAAPAEARAAIDKQVRRVLSIGQRAGYDENPAVATLVRQVSEGGKLKLNKPFYIAGLSELKDGTLKIEVDAINFQPLPWWNKEELPVGTDKKQGAASQAYAQALYAILKGAALRAEADPAIKRTEIGGWKVMNKDLAAQFQRLGFTRVAHPFVAGTPYEDRYPASWVLRVPVRP